MVYFRFIVFAWFLAFQYRLRVQIGKQNALFPDFLFVAVEDGMERAAGFKSLCGLDFGTLLFARAIVDEACQAVDVTAEARTIGQKAAEPLHMAGEGLYDDSHVDHGEECADADYMPLP